MSTVTMLACAIAGSFAQPSTFTTLAANGPPSCSASPRGTTNSANSMTTAMPLRRRAARRRSRAGSACAAGSDRSARAPSRARAGASSTSRLRAERLLQPVGPVLAAAHRAHAAAAVVVQHDVVARRTSPRRETPAATAAVPFDGTTSNTLPCSRNCAADPDRNRSRISTAHSGSSRRSLASPCAPRPIGIGGALGQQILHRAEHLLLVANPLRRRPERRRDLIDAARQHFGIGRERGLLADQLDLLLDADRARRR